MKYSNITKYKSAYFFKRLKKFPILVSFSDRSQDLSFKANTKNRKRFLERLGIDYGNLVCVKQIHKSKIVSVTKKHRGKGALNYKTAISYADGLVTKEKGVPLAVFTADCLSIFLFCPERKTIALLHAGWKGTKEAIAKKAIFILKQKFACKPQDIIVAFGPAIRRCCYEVGREFRRYFKDGLIAKKDRLFLDLVKLNRNHLISSGVKKKNIIDSQICTSCQNKGFFSYRQEKDKAGRMMSIIMLK